MKKTMKNEYYVFEVEEVVQNIEPFSQYETLGKDLHHIIVKRKPILVTKQEDGKYATKDGKLLVVDEDFEKYASSYRARAGSFSTMIGEGRASAFVLELLGLSPKNIVALGKKFGQGAPFGIYSKKYALPVPAEKYVEEMSIIDRAKALVGKPIILSENKAEAAKQLEEIGINIEQMRMEAQAQQAQPE